MPQSQKPRRMQHQAFLALISKLDNDAVSDLVEEMDGDPHDTLLEKLRTYDAIRNPHKYVDVSVQKKKSKAK